MSVCVLVSHGVAHDATVNAGKFLAEYDPEFRGGLGVARWTDNIDEALRFPSVVEAIQFWRQQSVTRPLRDDGEPNRPLTAYTVEPRLIRPPSENRDGAG